MWVTFPDSLGLTPKLIRLMNSIRNLREVMEMLLEDGEPTLEGEFVGTQRVSLP